MEKPGPAAAISVTRMCIAFDGAYLLEAPTTHPASTDGHQPIPGLTTDDKGTATGVETAEQPLTSAIT